LTTEIEINSFQDQPMKNAPISTMTADLVLTIIFGVTATVIGLVTIWQNFQIVQVKVESVLPVH